MIEPQTVLLTVLWLQRSKQAISWWRHQMKTFPRNWPFVRGIHRFPVNSPHKDQWRGALMFSLICVWINDWVNNREAGDLRHYRAHYDVTVMWFWDKPDMCLTRTDPLFALVKKTKYMCCFHYCGGYSSLKSQIGPSQFHTNRHGYTWNMWHFIAKYKQT